MTFATLLVIALCLNDATLSVLLSRGILVRLSSRFRMNMVEPLGQRQSGGSDRSGGQVSKMCTVWVATRGIPITMHRKVVLTVCYGHAIRSILP